MKLEHRFLLKEINTLISISSDKVKEKIEQEIFGYAKTESGREFLKELSKNLANFYGTYIGMGFVAIIMGGKTYE